jgi:bifunctional non-homologous end joining protein LigD
MTAKTAHRAPARLKEYNLKLDFSVTPETAGKKARALLKRIFVVQKHKARRLHYDFRLEEGGVLKSWAVSKGPSLDPADRRLAVQTEDHPIDYASFEGRIPDGEYGGGPVVVWDAGYWENTTVHDGRPVSASAAFDRGHVRFRLFGQKLTGEFTLIRMPGQGRANWLLLKVDDEDAAPGVDIVTKKPASVLSGRSIEAIEHGKKGVRIWHSNR